MKSLSAIKLKQKLIAVTVGGAKNGIDLEEKAGVFAEYVQRAFPEYKVLDVNPTDTSAALNSISGIIRLRFPDGSKKRVFGKIHIESNTKSISALGAEKEYANAEMLGKVGWPVLQPLGRNTNSEYPLILYPVFSNPALFDMLEQAYCKGTRALTKNQIKLLAEYNRLVGVKEIDSLRVGTVEKAVDAPVQTLFLKRFEKGKRIDQWYNDNTQFFLPGLKRKLSWKKLLDMKWNINGVLFDTTLKTIINQARQYLAFRGENKALLIISHGDDHAGNVRLTEPATIFDPAFAGLNPISLDLKALAHTGFLPMAAMYYHPKGLEFSYSANGNQLIVQNNMLKLPNYPVQEKLAKQIIDLRTIPLLKAIKNNGENLANEINRIRCGLAGCALLTVNIVKLLKENDGRGIGLLPMTIMFAELKGLPMLNYLNQQIKQLT